MTVYSLLLIRRMGVSELFEFSQGVVHLLDVMQRGSPLQDRESEILIESACEGMPLLTKSHSRLALALAYVHTPIINPTIVWHRCGLVFSSVVLPLWIGLPPEGNSSVGKGQGGGQAMLCDCLARY